MGIARRQRRMFKRAYDKATKRLSVTPSKNTGLTEELINNIIKDYEAQSSSK